MYSHYTHYKGQICFTELLLNKNESSTSPYSFFYINFILLMTILFGGQNIFMLLKNKF